MIPFLENVPDRQFHRNRTDFGGKASSDPEFRGLGEQGTIIETKATEGGGHFKHRKVVYPTMNHSTKIT